MYAKVLITLSAATMFTSAAVYVAYFDDSEQYSPEATRQIISGNSGARHNCCHAKKACRTRPVSEPVSDQQLAWSAGLGFGASAKTPCAKDVNSPLAGLVGSSVFAVSKASKSPTCCSPE